MRAIAMARAAALVVLVASCDVSPRTEVIVTIDADNGVRAMASTVHVVVLGGAGATSGPTVERLNRTLHPGAGDPSYPFTVAVAPLNDDANRIYSITATALDGSGGFVSEARAISGFTSGHTLSIRLRLTDACTGRMCPADQTCSGGTCVSAMVSPTTLRDYGADAGFGPIDGGGDALVSDVGIDGGVPCSPAACAWGACTATGVCDDAVEIVAGGGYTCARRASGTVVCWGQFYITAIPRPTLVAGVTDAAEIAAGGQHMCARRTGGGVVCWGSNARGQIGDGRVLTIQPTPTPVSGLTDAIGIAARVTHSCAIRAMRTVLCWGVNDDGELGDGTRTERDTPALVTGLNDAVEITAGVSHTCARRASSGVVCWGQSAYGQLGDGLATHSVCGTDCSLTPVTVVDAADVVEIAAGQYHTCARRASGTVTCWGSNEYGQLGTGTASHSSCRPGAPVDCALAPVPVVGLSDAVEIAVGQTHTCARRASGSVVCWGTNGSGELGDGTMAARAIPTAVAGLVDAVEITADLTHSCARRVGGSVVCWGRNGSGELGDGTTMPHLTPNTVLPP